MLDALAPALAAAGVPDAPVRAWAARSAAVPHALSNVQLGDGFVTVYRHPTSFGHVDPDEPAHARARSPRPRAARCANRPTASRSPRARKQRTR